jgi:SAM-dependent methyltransferase
VDPGYARSYRDLYDHHWWWRARESFVVETLQELEPEGGFGRILDVGCGDGLFFEKLQKFGEPEGIETDASIVTEHGRTRGRIHVGPFDDTFAPDHTFGLVAMLDVIEHLEAPVAALAHAKSLLEPAGRVVLTVPAFPVLWTAHDDYNHHLRRYRRKDLEQEIAAAGLKILLIRHYFHWLFPLKLLAASIEKMRSAQQLPATVPPKFINTLLYSISRIEQWLTRRVHPPFGSSLIAVLRPE